VGEGEGQVLHRAKPADYDVMSAKRDNEDREVMVNHREDVLTEDLIFEGIYRYTNFTKFGYSFDFLYVQQEQPSGDVTCPKWQIEEMKSHVLSDEQYEEIIRDMKSSTKQYLVYLKRFAKSLERAARETGLIREWFDESLKVTGTIARFYVEWSISEEMNRRGIPVPTGRSEETDTTRVARELRRIAEDHAGEIRKAREAGNSVRISAELEEKLKKFCKRYGYLGMKYFTGHPWTLWEAYNMLLASKKGESEVGELADEGEKIYYESSLQRYAEQLLQLRTEKWEAMCQGTYLFRKMVTEHFTDRIYYPDFIYLRINEAVDVLGGRYLSQELVAEREHHVMEITDGGVKLLAGRKILAGSDKKMRKIWEIKGVCAQPGKARGTVKVVLTPKECGKVREGDVLVATMSTPDFLPGMMKAAAFVTDLGGMTCHVAIVSREMKKPCVIGTKNATKVLKDGDEVEVDATRGVVIVLRKNEV